MARPIHSVFQSAADGIARELRAPVRLIDAITGKSIELTNAIWDTGATNTAIRPDVALKLGLKATGMTRAGTAHGSADVNTYVIELDLPPLDNPNRKIRIRGITACGLDLPPNTEILVGMDVIALGDFIVENAHGKTTFSFCLPAFDNKYDMVAKANVVNKRNAKKNAKDSRKLLGPKKP